MQSHKINMCFDSCCPPTAFPCRVLQLALDDMRECVAQFQRGLVEALAFVEERKVGMTDALELAVGAMFARLQVRVTSCDRHSAMTTPNLITGSYVGH